MIRRILNWMKQERQWHREHIAAWQGKTEPLDDGLSQFQNECINKLEKSLSEKGLILSDRSLTGEKEMYISAVLPGSGRRVYIYLDAAEIEGKGKYGKGEYSFEEWGYKTPEELISSLVASALEVELDESIS